MTSIELKSGQSRNKMADLLRPYYDQQTPVIVKSYARHWKALKNWQDWDYLRTQVGHEWICDVEMDAYNQNPEESAGGRLSIPFESYLDYLTLYREQKRQGIPDDSPILYLAQNDLPHGLYNDIVLPPFLNISHPSEPTTGESSFLGQGKLYQCMFWMGPPGVKSPLHFDPLDNVLVQISGTKHVALLDRACPRQYLNVGEEHGQQENTSALDIPAILSGETKFAGDQDGFQFFEGMLEPGDALYIPSKWWHYVGSPSDFTINVNMWWR